MCYNEAQFAAAKKEVRTVKQKHLFPIKTLAFILALSLVLCVLPALTGMISVTAGDECFYGIQADGTAWSWGVWGSYA